MQRLQSYTDNGKALLSCHSQGSVLGAAVLLQIETPVSAKTSFLTYGSPLTRLYGRFFPAYFSQQALARLGSFLASGPQVDDRTCWRWRNLYRLSDPIGGAVFHEYSGTSEPRRKNQGNGDCNDVDRQLVDPVFAPADGDPCYPMILGHSGYFDDPAFQWTVASLRRGTLPPATASEDTVIQDVAHDPAATSVTSSPPLAPIAITPLGKS
jgi:hypothetical protein